MGGHPAALRCRSAPPPTSLARKNTSERKAVNQGEAAARGDRCCCCCWGCGAAGVVGDVHITFESGNQFRCPFSVPSFHVRCDRLVTWGGCFAKRVPSQQATKSRGRGRKILPHRLRKRRLPRRCPRTSSMTCRLCRGQRFRRASLESSVICCRHGANWMTEIYRWALLPYDGKRLLSRTKSRLFPAVCIDRL